MSLVAFHYRSYGTFFLYSKRLHNLYSGFTHYRNYRAYIPTAVLTTIGHNPLSAILLMMLLAFLLSLCSEADAFIAASLLSSFGFAPVMAFLVIGPMIDVKNLLMMKHYFTGKFIIGFISVITLVILGYSLLLGGVS